MTTSSARRRQDLRTRNALRPRAGTAATGLFVAGLAVSAAFGMLVTPLGSRTAVAQSVANPNDQPTPATVPSRNAAADRPTGQVSPPKAIDHSTSVTGSTARGRTNPLDHLPAEDRAATGGSRQQ